MDKQNTTPPDMIAQAGALLKLLQQGQRIAVAAADDEDDRAIVQASAVLAVAAELRDIRNQLADIAVALTHTLADGAAYSYDDVYKAYMSGLSIGATDDDPPATLYEQMRAEIDGLRQQLLKADADGAAYSYDDAYKAYIAGAVAQSRRRQRRTHCPVHPEATL